MLAHFAVEHAVQKGVPGVVIALGGGGGALATGARVTLGAAYSRAEQVERARDQKHARAELGDDARASGTNTTTVSQLAVFAVGPDAARGLAGQGAGDIESGAYTRLGGTPTRQALTAAYLELLENELKPLLPQGLAAAVYTQTTDVEIEINRYLTYDRQVEKMDAGVIRAAHEDLTGWTP